MNTKSLAFLSVFLVSILSISAQESSLLVASSIPIELKSKANAVVRLDDIRIEIQAFDQMRYHNKRIITILNKKGDSKQGAFMYYDKNQIIKKIEARIYDANGTEIKKFKKNDFEDNSAVDGGTLYSDNRVKYLKYTPIKYPYTVVFETEVEYKSTAFIPGWRPIEGFYVSTENAKYEIINSSGIEIKVKTTNFENYNLEKLSKLSYIAKNLKAIKWEAYSPSFGAYAPFLKVAMQDFSMEGVRGVNTNWMDFGKWMNDKLISDTQELPQSVKEEIQQLTVEAETDIDKARIVYNYMQNKTRYISVQVGIGGWKPMLASDVDKLGYGDCKALTNYTKALMDEVNVPSFYTVIYGDKDIRNIDKEFSATQGNHVILCVPDNDDFIWLECTNQTTPFGYNANFTDDRDALIITPEGGKIVHTKVYNTLGNLQKTYATIQLDILGGISAEVKISTEGTQYSNHDHLVTKEIKDQKLYYKEYWDNINNLDVVAMEFDNNKNDIVFSEIVSVSAKRYASKSGAIILLAPNLFNRVTSAPPRYKNRKLPFRVNRGFVDEDEFLITIPKNLKVDALKEAVDIKNKYGEYSCTIEELPDQTLLYKRRFLLHKGDFKKEEYKDFRAFWLQVVKHDKSKIALKNNN